MRFDSAPIIGWRGWTVKLDQPNLECLMRQAFWPPGERLIAECNRDQIFNLGPRCEPGASPSLRCDCGIHVFDHDRWVTEWLQDQPSVAAYGGRIRVMGRASLWGRVLEHEDGYRGQYAYPYDLTIASPHETLLPRRALVDLGVRLSREYRVEVDVADS